MKAFSFKIIKQDRKSKARLGIIKTQHGSFKTPAFVPVATLATVKALDSRDLKNLGTSVLFANTYHLHIRPGEKLIKKFGGLHCFMNWNKPIFTDSGGFQAFSLGYGMEHNINKLGTIFPKKKDPNLIQEKWAKIDDSGVTFKSHVDGRKIFLNPKKSIQIQMDLGTDIILAFDECTSPLSGYEYTKKAMERTHKWAAESLKAHKNKKQALYGIVQGGAYKNLRVKSAKFISSLDFDGYAIGGSLGNSKKDMHKILKWVVPLLPKEKPRHLLGIGGIDDLFECVERGIDTFDCVSPTRWARRGVLYISPKQGGNKKNKFRINISNARFKEDRKPIDKNCNCYVCNNYSRAYLRHLFISKELSYFRLASLHNMYFILNLMKEVREVLEKSTFKKLKKEWLG